MKRNDWVLIGGTKTRKSWHAPSSAPHESINERFLVLIGQDLESSVRQFSDLRVFRSSSKIAANH